MMMMMMSNVIDFHLISDYVLKIAPLGRGTTTTPF